MILVLILSAWVHHVATQQQLQHQYNEPFNVRYTKTLRNTHLQGASFRTINKERVEHCLFLCTPDWKCDSVNYNADLKLCVLNVKVEDEVTQETRLVKAEGWSYYEKEILTVNVIIYSMCVGEP